MAPLSADELAQVDAWWRAANYLSVGQIYLLDNPLLTEPLRPEHVKPRLLGHWGTTPGLNLIYTHLNRLIRRGTAPSSRCCTSTGGRSPTRPSPTASAAKSSSTSSVATGGRHASWKATSPKQCTRTWPPPSMTPSQTSAGRSRWRVRTAAARGPA